MKRFRLPTKLALAIAPIGLVALAAGAWVSWNSLEEARVEERVSYAAQVAADAMDSLVAVSTERAAMLDAAVGESTVNVDTAREASNRTIETLRNSVRELVPRASGPASGIAGAIFSHSSLSESRLEQAREGDPLSEETQELFDEIGNRLITVASQSTLYFGEPGPAREGDGAVSLARASFASFQQEQLLTRFTADESAIPPEEFEQRFASLESTVVDWLNNADDNSPTVRILGLARTQVQEDGAIPDPETFLYDRDEALAESASEILGRVATAADRAATTGRTEAATVAAVVLGVLFLTVVVALILGRSTVRRVRSVTRAAQHVADEELPKLVDALSNPKGKLEGSVPEELEEAGPDEVGELARSFSSLHGTLVEVANRQMDILRRGVSEIFVTLARRNGSLVDRQLALIDDLESRQEDPEILDGYYKLDHLATRMRRNAESLLVLAGSESPRMWSDPLEMGEVVRAALGEVDEYQRVDVLALEPARLKGQVVTDLSHLMSELLDNATQFSPPSERVRVTGLFDDDGYVITIADSGLGISEDRMSQINHLIVDPPVLGLALEPTLGMYVVAQLASRHGISVRLVPGVPGTTVRITLPRTLLESGGEDQGVDPPTVIDVPAEPSDNGASPDPKSVSIPPYAFRTAPHASPDKIPAAPVEGKPEPPTEPQEPEPERKPQPPVSPAAAPPSPRPDSVLPERQIEPSGRSKPDAPEREPDTPVEPEPDEPQVESEPSAASEPAPPAPPQDRSAPLPGPARSPGAPSRERPDRTPPSRPQRPPAERPTRAPSEGESSPSARPVPPTTERELPRRPTPRPAPEREQQPVTPGQAHRPPSPASRPDERRAPEAPPTPPSPRPVDSQERRARAADPPTRLPTRQPGSSFQGDVSEDGTSSVSKRGAEGIRNALDGYRLGRDIASHPPKQQDEQGSHSSERSDRDQGDES